MLVGNSGCLKVLKVSLPDLSSKMIDNYLLPPTVVCIQGILFVCENRRMAYY